MSVCVGGAVGLVEQTVEEARGSGGVATEETRGGEDTQHSV